jgi:hypothetical protein
LNRWVGGGLRWLLLQVAIKWIVGVGFFTFIWLKIFPDPSLHYTTLWYQRFQYIDMQLWASALCLCILSTEIKTLYKVEAARKGFLAKKMNFHFWLRFKNAHNLLPTFMIPWSDYAQSKVCCLMAFLAKTESHSMDLVKR